MNHDGDNGNNSDKKDGWIVPTPLIILSDEEWKSYFSFKKEKKIEQK